MNTKQWAVFFVTLLSFDYATATFFGNYRGVPKTYAGDNDGYYGWSSGCRCNEDLTSSLDKALKDCQYSLKGKYRNGCPLKDTNLEEYKFRNGKLKGLHKFERKSPYHCSMSDKDVRIFYKIRFYDLLVNYKLSLDKGIFGGFHGGNASLIGRIFGKILNSIFGIVIPEMYCTVILIRSFGDRGGFKVEGFYLNEIKDISFQEKRFSKHKNSIESYFRPICDHVIRHSLDDQFRGVFTKHVAKVSAEKDMFYYESSSRERSGDDYEESDESEGSYSYKYESSDSESS